MSENADVTRSVFIIMPISVPEHRLPLYDHSGGKNHFRRVLDALFVPAVEAIGYQPIVPSFKGTVHIQAEIVEALSSADMVLCDMSALNPNVFYELGARSALNLPAALVVDEHHKSVVPFDLRPIGYCLYESTLHAWEKEDQVKAIAEHMQETIAKGQQNALWRYFGVSATAEFNPSASTDQDKLDVIMRAITNLSGSSTEEAHELPTRHPGSQGPTPGRDKVESFFNWLNYMNVDGDLSARRDTLLYEAGAFRLPRHAYNALARATEETVDKDGHVPLKELVQWLESISWVS